jgi:molecular chaperone Hsp33
MGFKKEQDQSQSQGQNSLSSQLPPPPNQWVKCLSLQDNVRGVGIQVTELVQSMAARHGLKGAAARGLGEIVVGALLLASFSKKGQKVNLNVQGKGLYQQGLVDAHWDGVVRGYVIPRSITYAEEGFGPWGSGLMSVLRTQQEGKPPYIGTVPLVTGHLAKDLAYYWVQSEQIPTAMGIFVELQGESVSSAGGFLVQALPGATDEVISTLEEQIHQMEDWSRSFMEHGNPTRLLSQIFQNQSYSIVEERPVAFRCDCSWDRVERALRLTGTEELTALLHQVPTPVVHCDFCAKEYRLEPAVIQKLLDPSV